MLTCAGNSIHLRHTFGCSCENVKVFETENVSTCGGLEPPTFVFMPYALTISAIRAMHLLSRGVDIFKVKYTIEILTVRGQQQSFSTNVRMFLWMCQSFWDRKCLDLRGLEPLPEPKPNSDYSGVLNRSVEINTMMTSLNGNTFRVTGPLYGEFTGHRWILLTKASDTELWYFLWSEPK